MKYRVIWVLLFSAFCLTRLSFAQDMDTDKKSEEENKTDYTEAITLVDVWLDAMQQFEDIPGISAIALEDQEVIWKGAFGEANPEDGVSMKTNTICSVCSISKLFTSISIMNLYEDGLLRLDDEVGALLPEYDLSQQFDQSGPITVRQLLTH